MEGEIIFLKDDGSSLGSVCRLLGESLALELGPDWSGLLAPGARFRWDDLDFLGFLVRSGRFLRFFLAAWPLTELSGQVWLFTTFVSEISSPWDGLSPPFPLNLYAMCV